MTETALGWDHALSLRAQGAGDDELATILGGAPPGVLAVTGGFPNPGTFPEGVLDEIAGRLVRDDRGVALQYSPSAGVPSVRDYLVERQAQLQGRRPQLAELMVTSGGMECLELVSRSLLDPGDDVAVEGPTYLGAIMVFLGHRAQLTAVGTDAGGMLVDDLRARLEAGYRPKFVYTIPDYQNPSGRTLGLDRRRALVETCRRHGVVILEDVAYRETAYDGAPLPSLWSLAPDVVIQAGTFSKVFFPGVRLGWATGPAELIRALVAAKQTTDQCAGALGQRMVEEYGRAGHFERQLPAARAFYASQWTATRAALDAHLAAHCSWSEPTGGFFTWLTLPEGLDTTRLRPAAVEAGVTYVPGRPFHVDGGGARELRFSFSLLSEPDLDLAVRRLAGVVERALQPAAGGVP